MNCIIGALIDFMVKQRKANKEAILYGPITADQVHWGRGLEKTLDCVKMSAKTTMAAGSCCSQICQRTRRCAKESPPKTDHHHVVPQKPELLGDTITITYKSQKTR
jgi:hypothetical protein